VAKQTGTPRELEASLLVNAAGMLQSAKENCTARSSALGEALAYNRRLWSIFASAVADPKSPLPIEIRNNIASLSVFIFHQTLEAESKPAADKLSALIRINREVAAGLRGSETA